MLFRQSVVGLLVLTLLCSTLLVGCGRQGSFGERATPTPSGAEGFPLLRTRTPRPDAGSGGDDLAKHQKARVIHVVDGDTVDVVIDGRTHRVRYILINTPERGEFYGAEATAKNRELVEGEIVYLEKDVSETDRYNRLLRYVYLADGTMVNEELVRQGYAQVATFPPDVSYEPRMRAAQQEAMAANRGLWAGEAQGGERSLPRATPAACHSAYPDVCIPPPPPDLDCGDIPHRGFRVTGSDPHRFDGNRDGIACED